MDQRDVENENLRRSRQAADAIASALCDGVKAGHPRKRLLATIAAQLRPFRVQCPACQREMPVMLLGQDAARHMCVVARRSNFLTLRRWLEEQFERVRPVCASCAARTKHGPEDDECADAVAMDAAGTVAEA